MPLQSIYRSPQDDIIPLDVPHRLKLVAELNNMSISLLVRSNQDLEKAKKAIQVAIEISVLNHKLKSAQDDHRAFEYMTNLVDNYSMAEVLIAQMRDRIQETSSQAIAKDGIAYEHPIMLKELGNDYDISAIILYNMALANKKDSKHVLAMHYFELSLQLASEEQYRHYARDEGSRNGYMFTRQELRRAIIRNMIELSRATSQEEADQDILSEELWSVELELMLDFPVGARAA